MVSATQTLQHEPPENGIILLYSPWSFLQERDCRDIFRELKGKSRAAVTTVKRNNGAFQMLDRKVPLRFSQPAEIINFCKSVFYREKLNWKPWKPLLSQAALEMKENKAHTPLHFFSWRCQFGGLNPVVWCWKQPQVVQVMPTLQLHQLWCSPTATDPSNWDSQLTAPMPQTGGTGNKWGKASFTKPTCPGYWVGHWQPPTMSLLLTPWCLYHTRHLLTFQCSLHLYFPKKHPDQNYHLSDLNYF